MQTTPERRLLTILAADVVGYSALMGRDEAGTLAQLKASRALMAEEIARGRGRVFSTAGDSLLAEFGSVVNAVECAVRMQRGLAERNDALPEERRMRFRIGINLGDVMVDGEDLFGEGVNIAARLQALAEPGGILVSGAVFEQVRTKLTLGFDALGPLSVKNIADPIDAWRVLLDPEAVRPSVRAGVEAVRQHAKRPLWRRLRRSVALAGVVIAINLAINLLTWEGRLWFQWPTLGILVALGLRAAWAMGR